MCCRASDCTPGRVVRHNQFFSVLGVDPRIQFTHPSGRPMYMLQDCQPIEEVMV